MLNHELEFTDRAALLRAFEELALEGCVHDCAIDLDRLQISFDSRAPLGEALREAISKDGALVAARCTPAPAPAFDLARNIPRARRASNQGAAA